MIIGNQRLHFKQVGSTNDEVIQRAKDGAEEGLVITSDEQTAGRGRLGRSWISPAGKGVHCSILLRPARALTIAPHVTMMAALAAAEALAETAGIAARVKWPNDIIAGERKIGGVLTEVIRAAGAAPALVVGIGLNINHARDDFPEEVRDTATSALVETGSTRAVEDVTAALLRAMDRRYRSLRADGAAGIIEEFRRKDLTLRKHVRVIIGDEVVEGEAERIDENGALGVRICDRSLRLFVAGEVSVRTV